MLRVVKFFDYGRKLVAIWNDLVDFFYEVNPRYREVGTRPKSMVDPGQWDDPWAYDGTFENADEWGRARWAPTGVLVDGELVTTSMQMLNAGVEEFVEHSFYEQWDINGNGHRFKTDPAGNPLSPYHPWNKETIPKPGATNWKEKYSWSTSPRWDRQAMETGAYSRIWVAAMSQDHYQHDRFIHPTGSSLIFDLPKATLNGGPVEWKIPETWGAFERNRARAHCVLFNAAIAYDNPLLENYEKPEDFKGIDVLRAIRSFDPCMPCTTHIHTDDRTISRDVVTCACGSDDDGHAH